MGYMNLYLGILKSVKLVWPKVERPKQVRKERLFISFQRTPYEVIKVEKSQEGLDHHVLNTAVQYTRFIFIRKGLVGRSILGYLRL